MIGPFRPRPCLGAIFRQALQITRGATSPPPTCALLRASRHPKVFPITTFVSLGLSQPVLAGLFHTAYLFAQRVRGFDFVVIEVNPRHVGFYRRSLGFQVIGDERHNPRVEAPAVLLGISFADIAEHLHRHVGVAKQARRARSLYAYGFSPAEEAGVLGRLHVLNASPDTSLEVRD